MSLLDDIKVFNNQLDRWSSDLFEAIGRMASESIVEGSPLTGAPGQPVDTGVLKASWTRTYLDANTQLIASGGQASAYNYIIENGIADVASRSGNVTGHTQVRLTLRSPVGGFHSVALTIASFPQLVAAAQAAA